MIYLVPFLAVFGGYAIAILLKPENRSNLKLLLAFSGSFLLSLTVMHLLPEVYAGAGPKIGFYIMLGIILQIVLEFFSKGAEHGHVHGHPHQSGIPWLLFLSLCLHALLEGFPISRHEDLAWGIAVHHFPIAIILTVFFVRAGLGRMKLWAFMLVFAAMTPLGTAVSVYVPGLAQYYREITAVVIGILFHISSTIIFEASENHKFNLAKISMIGLGILGASLV
jgi:zinc transporter ZupT